MTSSPSDTYAVRAATTEDAERMAELLREKELELRGWTVASTGDVLDWWRLIELPTASWLVEDDGGLVAAGALMTMRSHGDFWGFVRPRAMGRGLGTRLLDLAEAAAREHGKSVLHVGTYAEDGVAAALLTSRGYRDVRHYFGMRIDLDAPPEPVWPEGIHGDTIAYEEARAFSDALDEAFADEWGWEPMDFEEWKRLRLDAPDTDLGLWFVARDGDEIAAAARCEPGRWGGGWVGAIGVRPAWRRRGLGLALLEHAFAEFHRRGQPTVRLGVDAQNPTGATRLYERAGMRVEAEDVVFEREL